MNKLKVLILCIFFLGVQTLWAQTASALIKQARAEADISKRIKLLTQAVTKSPEYALAWHYRADAYRELGKYKQALSDYTRAINLTPKDPFRYYARALAYRDYHKYTAAAEDLTKAISLKKDYPDFYLQRARIFKTLEKYNSAIADYNKYLAKRKKTPELALELAEAYSNSYKYEQAQAELHFVLLADPDNAEGYFWLGRIRQNQGLPDEAVSFYSKAVNRNAEFAPAFRYRAAVFKDMGELAAAADDYTRLLALKPEAIFYNRRGLVYEEMQQWDKALDDYNKTIEISPKWPIAYNNRGYIFLKQKKYAQAREDFETAIKLDNTLPTPYINLAGLYWLQKKDRRNVYRNLEMALKRNFRDFDSLYDEDRKGWMFKEINKTPEFRAVMYHD